ncbi:penicillin-binding protein [Spirosoma utsteinense]|uniref:Cell division protein FtsI (Penicillin-binding protein 3) n=1 Tax=Spirosoma utsteinense TaxID=2585773 RepID=A0ABR6W4J1_9BACT|nr:penicillin-binding protein [Spirosoma utsteinense]MBC3784389.1 cell division protein FtsI (penicillin-binding protein 3) [Spirosoma utsteinense]MBC3790812.1 cell division protein FtsI (penicillin-binding protein 3) [Spirosoma utsteinense]
MNIKQDIIQRANHVFYVVLALAFAVVMRLVYVQYFQTFKGQFWRERVAATLIQRDTIRAMRGNILAADGSLLATSLPTYVVGLDPTTAKPEYFGKKVDSLGLLLARIYKDRSARDYADLVRDARARKRRYVLLNRRRVTFQERQMMLKWPFFRSSAKVAARGGVLRPYYERYHPFGSMAERTIGNLDAKTGRGLIGLEASFQPALAGKNAVGLVEVLSGGIRKPVDDGPEMKPEPGMDLYTTIDVNFQDMAETSLRSALEKYKADKGCVIVMEVATGEIRAMANLSKRRDNTYVENFNHALAGRTDPGSTFKLATMMALMEEKAISLNQLVATGGGSMRYNGLGIHDAKRGGAGTITARQVFEKSSNVGIHLLMKSYFYSRPDLYCQYLRRFHLTQPTGIHMKGEAIPVVRNPDMKGWSKVSLTSMSYGYEMQITPLQMLAFYNAVANDGRWVRPMLVRKIKLANELVEDNQPEISAEPICSPETARKAQELLRGVVEHGTAKHINNPHYAIAGKTGTAQKVINGRYQVGKYYTSFIGYFPANNPKYTMITAIDSPQGNNIDLLYAGAVAAPVFKEVADRIVAYDIRMHAPIRAGGRQPRPASALLAGYADDLHTISSTLNMDSEPSTEGWVETTEDGRWKSRPTRPNQVPDVRGLTLRDALFLLENRGFRVVVEGKGKVKEQSVEPGTGSVDIAAKTITLKLG